MSMHMIEDMMESTVRLLYYNGHGRIDGISVCDICRNLYKLQDKFDCDYTVLRVKDELKALGYLKIFSVEDLPAEERAAAESLKDSRFLKNAYIDKDCRIYVPYASEMWHTLADSGIIPSSKAKPKELKTFKLAKLIILIAAEKAKIVGTEGNNAKAVLAYWYATLPTLMYLENCIRVNRAEFTTLRDMSGIPEAFALADELGLTDELEDLESMADDYEIPYLKGYAEPYIRWRDSDGGIELDEQTIQKKAALYWLQKQYKKADRFAARLPEPSATIFRSTITLSHCTEIVASGKMDRYPFSELTVAQVELMDLSSSGFAVPKVEKALTELLETCAKTPATTTPLYTMLAQCHFFLDKWGEGLKTLQTAFNLLFEEAKEKTSSTSLANFTAGYYQAVINLCPLNVLNDLPLPEKILPTKQAAQSLIDTAEREGANSERCVRIAALYLVENDFRQAAVWLGKAKEQDENDTYSVPIALIERKFNMAKTAQLAANFENENNLAKKYLKGLQLAYYKSRQGKEWHDFETVYAGTSKEDINALKALYPDVPASLIQLLEHVDGTYYRDYSGEKVTFYFLGSDVKKYPYYLLSAAQIVKDKDAAGWLKEYIARDNPYDNVDEKIADKADNICWLHFADCMNNGGGSQLFIDFSPSGKGKKGQIIRFLHDPDTLTVIADSFNEYLQMLIDKKYDFVMSDYERMRAEVIS